MCTVSSRPFISGIAVSAYPIPAVVQDPKSGAKSRPDAILWSGSTLFLSGRIGCTASGGLRCRGGGFAEITAASVSLPAEGAIPVGELSGTLFGSLTDAARSLSAAALPEDRDLAEKLVQDMLAVKANAGH